MDKIQDLEWLEKQLKSPLEDDEIDIEEFLNEIENKNDLLNDNDNPSDTNFLKQKSRISTGLSLLKNKIESQTSWGGASSNSKAGQVNNDFLDGIKDMLSLESDSDEEGSLKDDDDDNNDCENNINNGNNSNSERLRKTSLKRKSIKIKKKKENEEVD